MKRSVFFLCLAILIRSASFCQEIPKDVAPDNAAYDAISDLTDRGIYVSQGNPDGLFHGDRKTTKYENAYLAAKLALSLRRVSSAEIDVSDIKDEIAYLRNEIAQANQQPQGTNAVNISGSAQLMSRFGSVIAYDGSERAPLGPETNYRLKLTAKKELGPDAKLAMNLDTMDGGFNSATNRDFPIKLLDFEGALTADVGLQKPLTLKAIFGPGSVLHRDTTGAMPSEDYTYFDRPKPSLIAQTMVSGYKITGAFVARSMQQSGLVGTDEVYLKIAPPGGSVPLLGSLETESTTRFMSTSFIGPLEGPNDLRQEIAFYFTQNENVNEKLTFGASQSEDPNLNFYGNFEVNIKDMLSNSVSIRINSVGKEYRKPFEYLEFVPLNLFNRKILDDTVDVGLLVTHPISGSLRLNSKTEWVADSRLEMGSNIPGTSFTQELSLDCKISRNLVLNAYYRYYYVPSKIAQFAVPVPEFSDIVGFGLSYSF